MAANNFNIEGLSTESVAQSREKSGSNKLEYKKEKTP